MMPSPDDPADLELPTDRMRAMGRAVLGRLIDHIAALDDQPACGDVRAEDLCRAMREPPPEHGAALEGLLEPLFRDWIPRSFNAASPGYLAYIPGGGIFPAALADLIADGVNRYTGVWQAAPGWSSSRPTSLDWLRDWMGFPADNARPVHYRRLDGHLQRHPLRRERLLGPDLRAGVLYSSASGPCLGRQVGPAGRHPARPGAHCPGR